MLTIIFGLMGKIVLLIALGYILRRKGIITEQFQKDITAFMMNVALPASILLTANSPMSREYLANIQTTVIIGVIYYAGLWLLMALFSKLLPFSYQKRLMFSILVVFANNAFVGTPLVLEVIGTEGHLYAVMLNNVWHILFFVIGTTLISGQKKLQLKAIFTTPASAASILAVLIYLSPIRYPVVIQETLLYLSGMVVPISMLVIGCTFVQSPVLEVLKDPWAYLVSVLRLVLVPIVVLTTLYIIPGIPNVVALTCCLMFCLPCGTLSAIYAQQYNCEPDFVSRAAVQSMMIMLVTIPLYLICASAVFPIN